MTIKVISALHIIRELVLKADAAAENDLDMYMY